MDSDTTDPSYWLNWRFFLCATWVLSSVSIACILLWRYEGSDHDRKGREEAQHGNIGISCVEESWMPCLKTIHPVCLLVYRVIAFFVCLVLLIVNIFTNGISVLYFYTQLTFLLVTLYFGLGSLLSAYGCHRYIKLTGEEHYLLLDSESNTYIAPMNYETSNDPHIMKNHGLHENLSMWKFTRLGCHLFQIIYQTNAGAVMLTDFVFWLVIFPFLNNKDYDLSFLQKGMHSLNAVFLIGDTALNCLRFPWFRIAYFILWTSAFTIFQWILHACISIWWPYPFLDLSSSHSPIWYLAIAVMHVPCYAAFSLIIRIKNCLLVRWFPHSCYLVS